MSNRDRAYALLQLGRAEEALELLSRDFDETDSWSWHVHVAALLQLERWEKGARVAELALSEHAEEEYLFDALAAARLGLEDYRGAEEAILHALRLDAANPEFLTRYAHVVARVGQLEKAEKLVLRALAIDPENEFALQMHALLAVARSDRTEAAERSRELLRHWPEAPLGHRLLGVADADDDVDSAADHARRAAALEPHDNDAAEFARDLRTRSHWLMWPLRPLMKFGPGAVWLAFIVTMFTLRALKQRTALAVLLVVWLVYCVYSWTVPHLVKRLVRQDSLPR